MFWRVMGIGSLVWGGIVFYILSTTPPPAVEKVTIDSSVEFAINILSIGWLIGSSLVKVGLNLKQRWTKITSISSNCFIFLIINASLIQASIHQKTPSLEKASAYPYGLMASWFISWFWIDTFSLLTSITDWIKKKMFPV